MHVGSEHPGLEALLPLLRLSLPEQWHRVRQLAYAGHTNCHVCPTNDPLCGLQFCLLQLPNVHWQRKTAPSLRRRSATPPWPLRWRP